MPEMPEVETIRRILADKITGRRIKNKDVLFPRLIKWPDEFSFKAGLIGKRIKEVARKGKYLLFVLEDNMILVVHLRMTGRIYYSAGKAQQDNYTRIIFELDNCDRLIYADKRTLGTLYAVASNELSRINGLNTMGPEPLSEEFSPDYLQNILAGRNAKVKALLLDQKVIGGLGNIYVDESLALAGVRPDRSAQNLTKAEIKKLHKAINRVILDGIKHGGTTFSDYRDGAGQSGQHQNFLNVYGRKNQPCRNCNTLIERIAVAGRGTHFCPRCQI